MQLSLQYCAGLFDGEGTIGIVPTIQRKSSTRWAFQARASLVIREKFMIDAFGNLFGGTTHLDRRPKLGRSAYWRWFATGMTAYDFCKQVLPYLQLKRKQAEILIEFQEAKLAKVQSSSFTKLRDNEYDNYVRLYTMMRALNQKGIGK